ncbi:nucleoside phosphorylase domain-containing protein [Aspergillus varians]
MAHPKHYTVGWICSSSTAYVAAQVCLDEKHDEPSYLPPHNKNDYTLGRIGKHNVVISVLPMGDYGSPSAARVAESMAHSFPNISVNLMVGIGGGAPSPKHDIRLGDIVVSMPTNGRGGVFQYDFGRAMQDQGLQSTTFLNQPPTILRAAVNGLKSQYEIEGHQLEETVNKILEKNPRLRKCYKRPDPTSDRLYQRDIVHSSDGRLPCAWNCDDDPSHLVSRHSRTEDDDNPAIHYGLIGSANRIMEDAMVRDKLAAKWDVLCFEMEAAGVMNHFPCLVICGISNYADSHKNNDWKGYAAMVAALYAKDLLYRVAGQQVEQETKMINIPNQGSHHTDIALGTHNYAFPVGVRNVPVMEMLRPRDEAFTVQENSVKAIEGRGR